MEKKSKILIFAGTTEGRELAEFLSEREVEAEISVATEYGETLLSPGPFLKIHQGRMEEGEMEAFFREEEIGTVVDATHPYAWWFRKISVRPVPIPAPSTSAS